MKTFEDVLICVKKDFNEALNLKAGSYERAKKMLDVQILASVGGRATRFYFNCAHTDVCWASTLNNHAELFYRLMKKSHKID